MYSARDEGPRHATRLELYVDLVFVVAVAELSHLLSTSVSLGGFVGFVGLFILVWYAWLGFGYDADEIDTGDLIHGIEMIATMVTVIAPSVTVEGALTGNSRDFAATFLVLRVPLSGMYVRAWLDVTELRTFPTYLIAVDAARAGIWAKSLAVPEPERFAVWALAFPVGVSGTFGITWASAGSRRRPPTSPSGSGCSLSSCWAR